MSRGIYQVDAVILEDLKEQLNFLLQRISDRLDKIEGVRGTASIESDLDMNGNDIINVGACGTSSESSSSSDSRSTKIWTFDSPVGTSGTFYFGGFYDFHSVAFTPVVGGTTVGTANSSYAAHCIVVLGADSAGMLVEVSGTSINDLGERTANDTEVIDTISGSVNDYYETDKKFIGQVTYKLVGGTGISINAGFSKYWDFGNTDFTVTGLEVLWLGGANDSGPNIELLHHKLTGWTYGAGGSPTPPSAIASFDDDHGTESQVVNGENGAWKRTNLSQAVAGSQSEGTLWRITTTANSAFELGNLEITVQQ